MTPDTGRLYHYLAIVDGHSVIQQFFYYCKGVEVSQPYTPTRESFSLKNSYTDAIKGLTTCLELFNYGKSLLESLLTCSTTGKAGHPKPDVGYGQSTEEDWGSTPGDVGSNKVTFGSRCSDKPDPSSWVNFEQQSTGRGLRVEFEYIKLYGINILHVGLGYFDEALNSFRTLLDNHLNESKSQWTVSDPHTCSYQVADKNRFPVAKWLFVISWALTAVVMSQPTHLAIGTSLASGTPLASGTTPFFLRVLV